MTDDLASWLRAQLDEDEAFARDIDGTGEWYTPATGVLALGGVAGLDGLVQGPRSFVNHATHHDPARVLREVEAKRRIIDWVVDNQVPNSTIGDDFTFPLYALAASYSDRAGYRNEWKP